MKLDVCKLALDENVASDELAELLVEQVADQASQGWGVSEVDSVVMRLAREVVRLQPFEEKVDEAQRLMKGAQLQVGRIRKQVENLEPQVAALQNRIKKLEDEKQRLSDQLTELRNDNAEAST